MKEKIGKKGIANRLFSIVLSLVMVITLIPIGNTVAFAASSGDVVFDTNDTWSTDISTKSISCTKDGVTLTIAGSQYQVTKMGTYYFEFGSGGTATITVNAGTETVTGITVADSSSNFGLTGAGPWTCPIETNKIRNDSISMNPNSFTVHIDNPGGEGKDEGAGSCPTIPFESEVAVAPTIPTDYVAERVAEEEAMEVSPVTVDTAQYGAGEAAVVPATSYNLSKFVTTKGIVKGIKTAVEAANNNKKDVAEIYTGKPFCFNKEIIKAIQEGNKTVVYYFAHEGHIYSVTVPATVDAAKVLEQAGFAGPLYVGQQLGTTKLIK